MRSTRRAPPFAYTDSTTVNDDAVAGALRLLRHIFGDPVGDADLFTNSIDANAARCQLELLKRVNKLENTLLKATNKAKKGFFKDAVVIRAAELEAEIAAVFSLNGKVLSKQDQLVQKVDEKCATVPNPEAVFPGTCAKPTLAEVEQCVIGAARCQACLKINAFDALELDCDQLDDSTTNLSCP
jgi:hypothetical protein